MRIISLIKKTFELLFCITCIFLLFSCASKEEYNKLSSKDLAENNELYENDFLFSYNIPDGYNHRESHDDDSTVYFYKEGDFDGKEGYISLTSLDKIDVSLEELINQYCNYFESESAIKSYTYETHLNKNNIQCLYFSLELADYYDNICYVLTDERDICVEAICYTSNSTILKGYNELINSITY